MHDTLHGFRELQGTWTVTLESKLAKHMDGIAHKPLLEVFLEVRKTCGLLEKGRCLKILRGYGLGPNLALLLKNYWKRQSIVPKLGKCLGTFFETGRRVTQVEPAFPMVLNIVVDTVVWEVLDVVCIPQEA